MLDFSKDRKDSTRKMKYIKHNDTVYYSEYIVALPVICTRIYTQYKVKTIDERKMRRTRTRKRGARKTHINEGG